MEPLPGHARYGANWAGGMTQVQVKCECGWLSNWLPLQGSVFQDLEEEYQVHLTEVLNE